MAAHALAEVALRDQCQLKAFGPIGAQEGTLVAGARIGADHLARATELISRASPKSSLPELSATIVSSPAP
jgi:hypothetical protein